ncbi:VWA domain-containing protein [Methanoculleus sp.]|uniref:VWA domain-containing protein n=1 Tax=Methanoculleus sp. TaxID=90427 RepID=UPI001BD64AF6|nr:VWA domain-containing protein [Methanoculleus sp.]
MCAYIIVAGLLLLAAPAGALVPDKIEVGTSSEWLTAGSSETVIVAVQVSDSATGYTGFGGGSVEFEVDGAYGSIAPAVATTDATGMATAVFTPRTVSGTAPITVTVSYEVLDEPLAGSIDQQIDHAAPDDDSVWYGPNVTVGGTTDLIVRMTDRYGNVVDNRREAEIAHFMVGSPEGGSGATFVGGTDEISVPVDAAGNATVTLRADTVAGENIVWIRTPVGEQRIIIVGVAGLPSSIAQTVVPASGSVPADGMTKVSFTYTLFDGYGNPVPGQGLWVNASMQRGDRPAEQESALLYSNSRGQVMITYGPEDSVGIATLTATAAANPNVSVSQAVEFTSTDPVNMLLSASPQSMPSRDVKAETVSQIRAKVMDVRGNPVEAETVTFEIVSANCTPYVQTMEPALAAASDDTDSNGYAIVEFHPGAFTTDRDAPGWSDTATGTATVRATWGNVSRNIVLTWKNYPYLSVETAVSPETVAVNDTVDITIRLRGDGWALHPDPIDVVLCTDRSGSMLYDDPDRMHSVREAAKMFVDQFSENYDRAATVSFGRDGYISRPGANSGISTYEIDNDYSYPRTYDDHATLDIGLTYDFPAVKDALDGVVPDHGTPLRHGLKVSIGHLVAGANDGSVRAVVLLTDGDYNWYGDPLARGSGSTYTSPENYGTLTQNYYRYADLPSQWQNLSAYAADNDIRIFTISYSESLSSSARSTLRTIAESTGGKYYHAPDPGALGPIYTEIAGALKTEAGVDTELDVVFENVEVNEAFVSGVDVFDYVHEAGASTTVESWVDNETPPYVIVPFTTIDQTADWNDDHSLHFDIGTVRLGQTWETVFRLKVLTDGNINVFGPGSTISFNNGTDSLTLPDTFITAHHLNNTGMDFGELNISNLRFTGEEPVDEFLPVAWDLNYTGLYGVTQDVFYSNDNEYTWVRFDRISATNETTSGESTLYVRDLPAGIYIIRVYCYAPDTEDASARLAQEVVVGENGSTYIQLR